MSTNPSSVKGLTALFLCLPSAMTAQSGPTPHPLGAVIATSVQSFGRVSQLVPLSDGRVFVADAVSRVVLAAGCRPLKPKVVLDSAAGKANSWSLGSVLIPFRADSTLLFDAGPNVFVVIAPDGTLAHTMAMISMTDEDPLSSALTPMAPRRSPRRSAWCIDAPMARYRGPLVHRLALQTSSRGSRTRFRWCAGTLPPDSGIASPRSALATSGLFVLDQREPRVVRLRGSFRSTMTWR